MMKDNNQELFNKTIEKLKYRINYNINESPKYRPLVGMDEVFDELPSSNKEDDRMSVKNQNQEPVPDEKQASPEELGPQVPETPVPAFDAGGEDTPLGGQPANPLGNDMMSAVPEQTVDMQQNDIIRDNIETLKLIHNKLETLENLSTTLETTIQNLNAKVEEVKEPTDGEKLRMKKEVSYPFYLNLSDLWEDNWFSQKREEQNENGIRQLEDGTYVADFDDLPKYTPQDIKQSYS